MLIIFDCDGVLRSFSWQGIFLSYQAICRFAGRNPNKLFTDMKSFHQWFDYDWHANMRNIGLNKKHYPEVTRIFHEIHDPLIQTFPWVESVFRELATRHTLTVLSSSTSKSVRLSLACCVPYVATFVGSDDVRKIKPHPEGIHYLMGLHQASRQETLIIGDAEPDIIAGKNAGIQTGAVDWGIRRIGIHLAELEPDFVFHSPEDLLSL